MTDALNLKPCPFCGGNAISDDGSYIIRCETGCTARINSDSTDDVASAWNTRVPVTASEIPGNNEVIKRIAVYLNEKYNSDVQCNWNALDVFEVRAKEILTLISWKDAPNENDTIKSSLCRFLCNDHCGLCVSADRCEGNYLQDFGDMADKIMVICAQPVRESVAPDEWYCDIDPDERGDTPYKAMFSYRPRLEPTKIHGASFGLTKWGVMAPSLTEDGDEAHVFDTEEEAQRFCNEREALSEIEDGSVNG